MVPDLSDRHTVSINGGRTANIKQTQFTIDIHKTN
jgi:hypothetical protein